MVFVVVLLLITAACMMIIIAVSGSKKTKEKEERLTGPPPHSGLTPGTGAGVRPHIPEPGVRNPVPPAPDGGKDPLGGKTPDREEDVDVLYQYFRESPVWVCSYCETENVLDHDRCSVCDHLNDRG